MSDGCICRCEFCGSWMDLAGVRWERYGCVTCGVMDVVLR